MSHALLSIAFHEYALAGLAYLAYLVRQWKLLPLIGRALVGSGLVLHAIALAAQGVPQGMAQGLSALAFLLLFILLALDLRYRMPVIGAFLTPIAVAVLVPGLLTHGGPALPNSVRRPLLPLHISIALLGLAAFAVATGVAVMYLLLDRQPGRLLGLAIQANCHPGCLGPVRRLVNSPGLCRVAGAEGGDADNGGILPLAGLLFFALPDSLRRRPSIMELLCLGLSHKTAPIGVRERLALPAEHQEQLLRKLCTAPAEAMVVSTCNRVEFYLVAADLPRAKATVVEEIHARIGSVSTDHWYEHHGDAALVHLFRVACSLDSMVIGEAQILGQVKEAFELAQRLGAAGGELTRACSAAFTAAKRVRSETGIGRAPVSMASAAVELAEKIFGGLSGKRVLMVGAGEIAELTVKHLSSAGATEIVIANRTLQRAQALASILGAVARPFEELPVLLIAADMVISSTASPTPLFTQETVSPVLKSRRFRPLFMLDIAVPRDIAPDVNQLDGVYAYDLDDIQKVVVENTAVRGAEAEKVEALIAEEIAKFVRARSVRDGVPVLALLRARADQIARAELEKTLSSLGEGLSEKQRRSIESMALAIINKLLHQPTAKLREASLEEGVSRLAGAAAELFGLEETPSSPDPPPAIAQRGRQR